MINALPIHLVSVIWNLQKTNPSCWYKEELGAGNGRGGSAGRGKRKPVLGTVRRLGQDMPMPPVRR